jgi:hypothetical protein
MGVTDGDQRHRISPRIQSVLMFLAAIEMIIAVEFVEEFYRVGFQPTGTSWFIPAWLQSCDIARFELVHESLRSSFLDIVMWLITRTGSTVF